MLSKCELLETKITSHETIMKFPDLVESFKEIRHSNEHLITAIGFHSAKNGLGVA